MSLSLVENVIVTGADNRHPMLDKTNYSSWASHMLLYIKGKEHVKLLVDLVLNGPFQYKTIVEPRNETTSATVRAQTYTDLTDEEKIRKLVDIKATNIVLQGLPQDIYNLVNHNEHAKQIWDRVRLLIQDVTLAKYMHTTNFDHLYAHLRQHEAHANEVHLKRQRYPNQIALVSNSPTCLNSTRYYLQMSSATQQYYSPPALQRSYDALIVKQSQYQPQVQSFSIELDSGLVVPSFNPSNDPIANLNKLMAFVSTTFAPRFPQTNNQLRTSSNTRNQATIQDGRVTV
ncbi:hypothetical protein Tco_0390774 [Tanacetum coccineum]